MRARRGGRWATAAGIGLVVTALLGPLAPAPPASASTQYGRVVHIDDGDTVDVDLERGGVVRVRFIAIQAMELTEYHREVRGKVSPEIRGHCHAVAATRRLHSLVYGKRVRLTSRFASSRRGSRLARFVAVQRGGDWSDVGAILMAEGHTLLSVNPVEYGRNRRYRELAQRAAAAGTRIWDTDACGRGPAAAAELRVSVRWDAEGNDGANVNGEWIRISSSTPVSLAGWWVRDSAMRGNRGVTAPVRSRHGGAPRPAGLRARRQGPGAHHVVGRARLHGHGRSDLRERHGGADVPR